MTSGLCHHQSLSVESVTLIDERLLQLNNGRSWCEYPKQRRT